MLFLGKTLVFLINSVKFVDPEFNPIEVIGLVAIEIDLDKRVFPSFSFCLKIAFYKIEASILILESLFLSLKLYIVELGERIPEFYAC